MQPEVVGQPFRARNRARARASSSSTSFERQNRAINSTLASAGVAARLDQRDDLVDVGQRNRQALEDVATLARLAELEHACAA